VSDEMTPKWREDFPIEWGADNYVTRREFTKFLVLISGATFLGNGYFVLQHYRQHLEKFARQPIARTDELAVGQVKLFRYPDADSPALLIRLASGEHVAYLQRCTHLSCPVHFAAKANRLECPCHNGAFDATTGNVLEGPPPRPLPRILLKTEGEQIFAVGVQGA
jgi:arsenite oxidase small subunit